MNGLRGRRALGILLAATVIAGCTIGHFTQNSEEMLVRTGSTDVQLVAAPFADVFLTYALFRTKGTRTQPTKREQSFLPTTPTAIRLASPRAWT